MSRKNAQKSLSDTLTPHQAERRENRIQARTTVAERISREQQLTGAVVVGLVHLLQRGFFGRLKWLLFGK